MRKVFVLLSFVSLNLSAQDVTQNESSINL